MLILTLDAARKRQVDKDILGATRFRRACTGALRRVVVREAT